MTVAARGLSVSRARPATDGPALRSHLPVVIVVEGRHDAEFLRRMSARLHDRVPSLPDLPRLERLGAVLFVSSGGDPAAWTDRLAPLGKPEFHLFDSEAPPETQRRRAAAARINARSGCRAFVTGKRSIENYLHPDAIQETRALTVAFGDCDCVPELVSRRLFETSHGGVSWDDLPYRVRRRLRERAKRWLNRDAVDRMTLERLRDRDPHGEVVSWLRTIAELVDGAP